MKRTKVAICIPIQDFICGGFFQSFLNLIEYSQSMFDLRIFTSGLKPLDVARNSLVSLALLENPDFILFIDSDHSFNYDLLEKFVDYSKYEEADIVCAEYPMKVPPFKTVKDGLGFVLIKKRVFNTIPSPWFKFEFDERGKLTVGEDVGFFKECEKIGFKRIVKGKIRHIGGLGR